MCRIRIMHFILFLTCLFQCRCATYHWGKTVKRNKRKMVKRNKRIGVCLSVPLIWCFRNVFIIFSFSYSIHLSSFPFLPIDHDRQMFDNNVLPLKWFLLKQPGNGKITLTTTLHLLQTAQMQREYENQRMIQRRSVLRCHNTACVHYHCQRARYT